MTIANPPATISGFSIDADSMTNFVTGDVDISNLRIQLQLNGSGIAPSCGLRLEAANTQILGDYALQPDSVDPSNVDVNEIGNPSVSFTNFSQTFTSGICDFPLIGDLIQAIIGNVEPLVISGFEDYLKDPDGAGPLDAPVADAIEIALADISIAGPIGDTLQVNLDTPLFDVLEDNAGITLGSDTRFVATPVAGTPAPGECPQVPNAPDLRSFVSRDGGVPELRRHDSGGWAALPARHQHLDVGLQPAAQGADRVRPAPDLADRSRPRRRACSRVTAGTLPFFMPTLSCLQSRSADAHRSQPTLAPSPDGQSRDPAARSVRSGSRSCCSRAHRRRRPRATRLIISGAVDLRAGLGLDFDQRVARVLGVERDRPDDRVPEEQRERERNANSPRCWASCCPDLLPALGDGLGAFPLPEFFGLQLGGVEVSRNGQFYTIFADLTPTP